MGQDYNLKKLYEQMLKGSVAQEKPTTPRTLAEAYNKKLVVEKTAFYAKRITGDRSEDTPLVSLGVVEDDTEAKDVSNRIKSYTIYDNVKNMVTAAGWPLKGDIFSARDIAELLTASGINPEDVSIIAEQREKLNDLLTKHVSKEPSSIFDLYNCFYENFKNLGNIKTPKENFYHVFDELYQIKGQEGSGGKGVGPAEILISLFTNSSKPEKGDLLINNVVIEVKSSGARLGYANFAQEHIKTKMIQELGEKSVNRMLAAVKGELRSFVSDLKARSTSLPNYKVFTDKFYNSLQQVYSNLGSPDTIQKLEELGFSKTGLTKSSSQATINKIQKQTIDRFEQKQYLNRQVESNDSTTFEIIARTIIPAIRQIAKTSVEKAGKTVSAEDFKKQSPGVAIQQFFTTDLGLPPQTVRDVLYYLRPHESANESLMSDINKYVTDELVEDMTHGNIELLKQIVFAIHVSEYARQEEFNYLLITKQSNRHALPIPADKGFGYLFNFYEKHKSELNLNISFSERGAYVIQLLG
tara:strand:- start:1945 stop:3519 length:1575 start_codon:yes stop_codon:yes gene_type:complete